MDLRNSHGIALRNFYNRMEAFLENFHQKWQNASCPWSSIQVLPNQVSKNPIRLKILIYKSPMQTG